MLIVLHLAISVTATIIGIFALVEFAGPILAEREGGGTPWHAHHIAERHGLFAIIALGEGVVGTVAAISAVVEQQGWTLDAALVGMAGTGLTFGMWWVYFMLPSAAILRVHRERAFVWGYSQLLIVTAIVATGAGLHVAAYFIEHKAHISAVATVLTVAVPVSVFLGMIYALYYHLVRRFDPFHVWLLMATGCGRRRRSCRIAVGHRHVRLPRHPYLGAGRHRRWLRVTWISAPGGVAGD